MATLDVLWAEHFHHRVWGIEAGLRHRLPGICTSGMRARLLRRGGVRARRVV
jgi:hypothetical protein